jgi:hypothetical protein
MSVTKPNSPSEQERICYALTAVPLETGAEDVKRAIEAERKRKPRRKSIKALVEIAKKAGLGVTALNPDGSVSTGSKAEATSEGVLDLKTWRARHAR